MALALALAPWYADAAGLGRLTVLSALGEPLRAEIDLTASNEEFGSMAAKLASQEAFKNAGIDYVQILSTIRFSLERRAANGQPVIVVKSDRPLSEPFIDMLVEVNWASGRLVREYTFLLDPPDVFKKPAIAAAPEVKAVPAPAPVPAPVPEQAAPAIKPAEKPAPVSKPAEKAAEKPAAKEAASAGATRTVKKGDTLGKIAAEMKPEGVNLDQMLVALLRSNPDAFDAGNMNRLRAGKILGLPDREAAAAVDPSEARKIVVAQSADFNAYRKQLAGLAAAAPARAEAPQQAAGGKIAPRVEEKAPPTPAGKDKLEVSRTEAAKGAKAGGKGAAAAEEELVARDKALKDANTRIAELEKNLNDLKRLAELKSAGGAKLQEQAQAAKPGAAPEAKKAEPAPKPAAAPKPAEPAKPAETAKPAEPPKAAEAAKPAQTAPAPQPKPVKKPAPPPPPPPSFVEENPALVFGGAGIVALLLGWLGYNTWRKKRQAGQPVTGMAGVESAAPSVFGTTGGQSVDTSASLPTDFSQDSTAGATGDEGVDPVAEADVYMAYGRDRQAEEILLEALKSEPARTAIHLKLLEIYAARKNTQQFETVARELHALTGGDGPDWEKAARLGRSIDPANALYGGTPEPAPAAAAAAGDQGMDQTMIMPAAAFAQAAAPAPEAAAPEEEAPASLDFDLDLSEAPAAAAPVAAEAAEAPAAEEAMSLDFDLNIGAAPAAEPAAESAAEPPAAPAAEPEADAGLDFDISMPSATEPAAQPAAPAAEEKAEGGEVPPLDFDFNLGGTETPAAPPPPAAAATEPEMPALNLSDISLELGETPAAPEADEPAPAPAPAPEPEGFALDNPEVATKLELAQAYEEMGDKEGARELLNEVLSEGSPAQQAAARAKLAQLG